MCALQTSSKGRMVASVRTSGIFQIDVRGVV